LIRRLGPLAVLNPLVQFTLFTFLTGAHHAPSRQEAERAADAADALLREFLPDLSRQMSRTPDRLAQLQAAFQQTHDHAAQIHQALAATGVTSQLVARAQRVWGRRIRPSHLARWQRMTLHAMAVEAFATQNRASAETVRDQLRLAGKAEEIRTAWREFCTFLATRPIADQMRILGALSLPAPPLAPPPAP